MPSPRVRRRAAAVLFAVSVLVGWPMSWILPMIGEPWYERILMFVSMFAINLTAVDVLINTDMRAEGAGTS